MNSAQNAFIARLKGLFGTLSNRDVAALFGVSEGTVRNYLRIEGTRPSADFLRLVADHFGVNLDWLLSGDGPCMRVSGEPAGGGYEINEPQAVYGEHTLSAGMVRVPLYDLRASAGGGSITDDHPEFIRHFDFPEWWLRLVVRVSPKAVQVLVAWGDSMKPDVLPGDLLIIDTSHTSVQADCLYVFEMDGGVFIKKLQRLPGGKIKVISSNPDYEAYSLTPATDPTFKVVGRVAFHGKVM